MENVNMVLTTLKRAGEIAANKTENGYNDIIIFVIMIISAARLFFPPVFKFSILPKIEKFFSLHLLFSFFLIVRLHFRAHNDCFVVSGRPVGVLDTKHKAKNEHFKNFR